MSNAITTTIRWNQDELEDVKKSARLVGLPTSLFLKSIVLEKVRNQDEKYSPNLTKKILLTKEEAEKGDVDIFNSKEEFLNDLKLHMNDN
jgi:hypothetical protein